MTESITNINNFLHQNFDKVLVLTVPRFKERHEKVKQRLKGIDFEFFYGTDKDILDNHFINENYSHLNNNLLAVRHHFPPLNIGEIACSLSHRTIYETMVDKGWNHVLVFEDDVVPDFKNLHLIVDTINELPENWDLIYFGYLKNEKPTTRKKMKQFWYRIMSHFGFSRMPLEMIKRTLPKPFSQTLLKAGFHDCTHAYAISQQAAKKMIQAQTPVRYRADNLLSALILKGTLNAFISKLVFFNQEFFTDNQYPSYVKVK